MKNLLIIGAGVNQLPLIKTAKKMGYFVHTVSPKGDYPGINVADKWFCEDIFSVEKIIEYAKNNHIDGVISDQSDMATPIVAQIAEALGLPTFGYENSILFTDKSKMRELYEKLDLPVPKYRAVNSIEEAKEATISMGTPVVIKPTDSFSSKGITKVDNLQNVESAYTVAKECSRTGSVVVEKYVEGPQYFSQGFVSNFKYNLFAFSDRYYYDLPNVFIPYTNAFPALISDDLKNQMKETMQKIIDYCKPRFGHVWTEWIVDKNTNELYIVEMALRGAGAHVTTELIPHAYGIDTMPYLINAALGNDDDNIALEKIEPKKAAAFYSFLLPKGEIISVKGLEEAKLIPGVELIDYKDMNIGDITEEPINKNSRYGLAVLKANSRDELNQVWEELQNTIDIKVKTKNGIKGPIWQ